MDLQINSDGPRVPENLTAICLTAPLQHYMLPHLTADALAALLFSCKAVYQLITGENLASGASAQESNEQNLPLTFWGRGA